MVLREDDTATSCSDMDLQDIHDRHHFSILLNNNSFDFSDTLLPNYDGLVILLGEGLPNRSRLRLSQKAISNGIPLWYYWPRESGIEKIDEEKLFSFFRHARAFFIFNVLDLPRKLRLACSPYVRHTLRFIERAVSYLGKRGWVLYQKFSGKLRELGLVGIERVRRKLRLAYSHCARHTPRFIKRAVFYLEKRVFWPLYHKFHRTLRELELSGISRARRRCSRELENLKKQLPPIPVSFSEVEHTPSLLNPLGIGAYLRLDFWAPISSGGSYGHTCHVAKNLSLCSTKFKIFMAHRYSMMDDMGLDQEDLMPQRMGSRLYTVEMKMLLANKFYFRKLYPKIKDLNPDYIYERICLGNFVGAKISHVLKIPYIVEYNGSEISMRRSFEGVGYENESVYLLAEEVAFKQATVISVVSEAVRDDLLARGVTPSKILVNPNGVDPQMYSPPSPSEKADIREELGFGPEDRVIGFTGTFGGWHGIDILAEGLTSICAASESARFLMIGDGNYKYLIDEVVDKYSLQDKVVCTGRVPQLEGARYLKACDIFVSPHNSHMVDSRFFGSPTKIFEYMSLGCGVVASNLEQIGEVLSPGLRSGQKSLDGDELSILCDPGSVDQFVEGVLTLVNDDMLCSALGSNARRAAMDRYSWERHVERLLTFCFSDDARYGSRQEQNRVVTNDDYKERTQDQWDNDACGSHYVESASEDTLEWYLEVERHRYGDYAPWMPEVMEFSEHGGEQVLEIGAGLGTDLAQFAAHGAKVTDLDLSSGHLNHAQRNLSLRGLEAEFIHHDAEELPFEDDSFDLVYTNGVIHHTPNTRKVVEEIYRILKPGGRVIAMVYAENSLQYWVKLAWDIGFRNEQIKKFSMSEIMSRSVELSETGARPLVKVYNKSRLTKLFNHFEDLKIEKYQMMANEKPWPLFWLPVSLLGRFMGWNLVVKAQKSR